MSRHRNHTPGDQTQSGRIAKLFTFLKQEWELREASEAAGQHDFAYTLLNAFAERFPATEVAGEILQEVRERKDDYTTRAGGRDEVLKLLDAHLAAIEQEDLRKRIRPIRDAGRPR